jgi:hypothetical protein
MIGKRGCFERGWPGLAMARFRGGIIGVRWRALAERPFFLDWKMMCGWVIGFHEGSSDDEKENSRERHWCHFSGQVTTFCGVEQLTFGFLNEHPIHDQ